MAKLTDRQRDKIWRQRGQDSGDYGNPGPSVEDNQYTRMVPDDSYGNDQKQTGMSIGKTTGGKTVKKKDTRKSPKKPSAPQKDSVKKIKAGASNPAAQKSTKK